MARKQSPMPQPNPITQTYQAIRNGLLAQQGLRTILSNSAGNVRLLNIPDLSDNKEAINFPSRTPVDFPDIILKQGRFSLQPFGVNSKCATIRQSYPLSIAQESMSLTKTNDVNLQIFVALLRLGTNLGLSFVADWDITDGADSDEIRGERAADDRRRWITTAQINVQMNISKTDLLTLNP